MKGEIGGGGEGKIYVNRRIRKWNLTLSWSHLPWRRGKYLSG